MAALPGIVLLILAWPQAALATQSHGGMEGLYAHQIAHLFFIAAMALLMFWLKEKRLESQEGWRSIQLAALFFILWNADAFMVHFLETQPDLIRIADEGMWHLQIDAENGLAWLEIVYYAAKLDHLLSIPAMWFLFSGLRKLYRLSATSGARENDTP